MPQPPTSPRIGEEVDVNDLVPIGAEVDPSQLEPESTAPAAPEGSALGRFVGGVWENVNPVNIATGLYNTVAHPVETGAAIWNAQKGEWAKAKAAPSINEAIGHGVAAALPLVGPMVAHAGETIKSGDVARGLGQFTGLVAPLGVKPVLRGATSAVRAVVPQATLDARAAGLEASAARRIAETIKPKVGREKLRHGQTAEAVAPRLTTEPGMGALSTQTLGAKVADRLGQAQQTLDDVHTARQAAAPGQTFPTQPMIDALEARRKQFVAQSAPGQGGHVVPGPNAARVAQIDHALAELQALGPRVTYDAIRTMREAWDHQAAPRYNPSTTADFLTKKGEASGAADVTYALRDQMAKWSPETAAANAEYSFWRRTNDLMEVLEETESSRPKVGRRLMGQLTGTVLGAKAAGTTGAVVGWVAGPMVEAFAGSGATLQIQAARLMARLADAVRNGNVGGANAAAFDLKQLAKRATAATGRGVTAARTQQAQDYQPATP